MRNQSSAQTPHSDPGACGVTLYLAEMQTKYVELNGLPGITEQSDFGGRI